MAFNYNANNMNRIRPQRMIAPPQIFGNQQPMDFDQSQRIQTPTSESVSRLPVPPITQFTATNSQVHGNNFSSQVSNRFRPPISISNPTQQQYQAFGKPNSSVSDLQGGLQPNRFMYPNEPNSSFPNRLPVPPQFVPHSQVQGPVNPPFQSRFPINIVPEQVNPNLPANFSPNVPPPSSLPQQTSAPPNIMPNMPPPGYPTMFNQGIPGNIPNIPPPPTLMPGMPQYSTPNQMSELYTRSDMTQVNANFNNVPENIMSHQNEHDSKRVTDEAWLVDWLNKIKKTDDSKKSSEQEVKEYGEIVLPERETGDADEFGSVEKISEAQKQLRYLLVTMATLQKQAAVLENGAGVYSLAEWESEFSKTETLKQQLLKVQKSFTSPENIRELKMSIEKRRKKRERLRKRKQKKFQEKQAELEQREILHAKIDKWREGVTQKMLDAKQKVEMKKMADKTLSEVRSKISETIRKLDLLNGLKRLRKIRMESAMRIGRYTASESDSLFETQMSHLYNILTNQRLVYEGEEKTMKVLLEQEQEETQGIENQRKQKVKEQREKKMEKRKNEMLFGKEVELEETDPLYPFYEYYKQADGNFQSFLEIRHNWDFWLTGNNVTSGSCIPVDWVLPPIPSDVNWAKYLS